MINTETNMPDYLLFGITPQKETVPLYPNTHFTFGEAEKIAASLLSKRLVTEVIIYITRSVK